MDAPERILARTDYDGDVDGQWIDADAPRPHSFGHYFDEYILAAEHDRLMVEIAERTETAYAFLQEENRMLREALMGLVNALEITPGPRGVMDLVPERISIARASLGGDNG